MVIMEMRVKKRRLGSILALRFWQKLLRAFIEIRNNQVCFKVRKSCRLSYIKSLIFNLYQLFRINVKDCFRIAWITLLGENIRLNYWPIQMITVVTLPVELAIYPHRILYRPLLLSRDRVPDHLWIITERHRTYSSLQRWFWGQTTIGKMLATDPIMRVLSYYSKQIWLEDKWMCQEGRQAQHYSWLLEEEMPLSIWVCLLEQIEL